MISELLSFGTGFWIASKRRSKRATIVDMTDSIMDDENLVTVDNGNIPITEQDTENASDSVNEQSLPSLVLSDTASLDRLIRMNDFTTLTPRSVVRGGYLTCGIVPFNIDNLSIRLKESIMPIVIEHSETNDCITLLGGTVIYCANLNLVRLASGEEVDWESNILYDSPRWPSQVESFMSARGGALTVKGPFTTAFYDLLEVKGVKTTKYSISYPTNMLVHYYRNSAISGPSSVEYRVVDTLDYIDACEPVNTW